MGGVAVCLVARSRGCDWGRTLFGRMLIRWSIRPYHKPSCRHVPGRRGSSPRPRGFAQPECRRARQSRVCPGVLAVCVAPPLSPCHVPSSMAGGRMSRPTNTADFNVRMPQTSTPSRITGFGACDHSWRQLIRNMLYYVISSNLGARAARAAAQGCAGL